MAESFVWKQRKIPVCWENGTAANATDRAIVQSAIAGTWERESRVRFTEWDACTAGAPGIHIIIDDINPASNLGTLLDGKTATVIQQDGGLAKLGNGMVLNFAFNAWPVPITATETREYFIRIIAVHEFGHALGFRHEQARGDTPTWCTERDLPFDLTVCDRLVGEWDLSSVMNYCNPKYTGGGNLSSNDISMVRRYYGSPTTNTDTKDLNCVCPDGFSTEACSRLPVCEHVCRAHGFRSGHEHEPRTPHLVDCNPAPTCPPGLKWCTDRCVDTKNDVSHCGDCNRKCSGSERCSAGACEDCLASCALQCNVASPACGGSVTCVCPAGMRCEAAIQKCCSSSQKLCGDKCVNLSTDESNCGACGRKCDRGQCQAGKCECARCRCPDGFCAGPDACEGSQVCRNICRAHERPGVHQHEPCQ